MPQITINSRHVSSVDQLKKIRDKLGEDNTTIGYDIETGYDGPDKIGGSLDPDYGFTVGFSITNDPRWARYIPIRHDMGPNMDPDKVHEIIVEPLLTDKFKPGCVPHNAKFEKRWGRREWGIELNVKSDSMIEAFTLSEFPRFGLKPQVLETFGHKMTTLQDLFPDLNGKKLKCLRFNTLDLTPEVTAYACDDAAFALALHRRNYPRVMASEMKFIYTVDMAIMEILCDMEDEGVVINWDYLREGATRARTFNGKQLNEIRADLTALTKRSQAGLNINSSPQLGKVLYDELGWKTTRVTGSGAKSTDAVALEALSKRYPVVRKILDFREVQALASRFLEKWPNEFAGNSRDNRAHPSVNQCAVGTGRFAVQDPPTQQAPKPRPYVLDSGDKFLFNFRDCIEAPPGFYILDFDYSQVELRVMAGLSGEQTLIDAFNNGDDVHTITAAMMLNLTIDEIQSDQRAVGKTMNFALLYGMGVKSLADRLAISLEKAKELYANYFNGFSSITTWMEQMKDTGKRNGYTMSKFGRRYTIWELQSDVHKIYSKGERVCVNAPVQGGAADYMKIAMVRAAKALKKQGLWRNGVSLVLNNHDALTFYVRNDLHPQAIIPLIRSAVEFPVEGLPKIVAEFSIGQKWGSMSDASEDHEFRYTAFDDPTTPLDMYPRETLANHIGDGNWRWQVKCKKCGLWSPDHDAAVHKGAKPAAAPPTKSPDEFLLEAGKELGAQFEPGGDGWLHVVSKPGGDGRMTPTSEEVREHAEKIAARDTSSAPYLGSPEEIARGLSKMEVAANGEGGGSEETSSHSQTPASDAFQAQFEMRPWAVLSRATKANIESMDTNAAREFVTTARAALKALLDDKDPDIMASLEDVQKSIETLDSDNTVSDAKQVIIDLPKMPTAGEFKALVELLASNPGQNPYKVVTPEGEITGKAGISLLPPDQPKVSMILSGARVYHPASAVSADAFSDIM